MEKLIYTLRQQGITDPRLLEAICATPRHLFIEKQLAHLAYENIALSIGEQQTISQPYIVARMTELLATTPQMRVLEIGTGSGYQTAILARLTAMVYTIERINGLLLQAEHRFKQLALSNIITCHADGTLGWSAHAPFDAILVTAAATTIPPALLRQLVQGGRVVLPLGQDRQHLVCIHRQDNHFAIEKFDAVQFVPLISGCLH